MEKPNRTVAIVSNISGGCQYVAVVKTITPSEYATLLREQRQHEQKQREKERELEMQIEKLREEVYYLYKQVKVLKGEDYEESIED